MSLHPNTPILSATPSLTYSATPAYSPILSGQGEASSNSITIKKPTFDAASSSFQRPAIQNNIPGETGSEFGPGRTLSAGELWEERGIAHANFMPSGTDTQNMDLFGAILTPTDSPDVKTNVIHHPVPSQSISTSVFSAFSTSSVVVPPRPSLKHKCDNVTRHNESSTVLQDPDTFDPHAVLTITPVEGTSNMLNVVGTASALELNATLNIDMLDSKLQAFDRKHPNTIPCCFSPIFNLSLCNVTPPAATMPSAISEQQVHASMDAYASSINDVMDCSTNVHISLPESKTFIWHPQFRNFNMSIVPHLQFPYSRVSTPVYSADQWIDTHKSIHIGPTKDSTHMSLSPLPPYISNDSHFSESEDSDTMSETEVQVQQYLHSDLLAIDDTHTLFISDAMQAVYAFAHCQDQLIVNDWDPDSDILLILVHQFQFHPTLLLDQGLNETGPSVYQSSLTIKHMLEALLLWLKMLFLLHSRIGTHIPPSYYQSLYPPINPFFTEDETKHLYAIAAVTEFHSEHQLTSQIDDALHMPFPDANIVHALTQQNILDEQYGSDIVAFACA
ncbi:hypothetical protein BD769DRAFT_1672108 [Suillus cothurnatus]|nr:hypothetical protein BD769DRAFT_1672108 [Suillus cothurnatus]